MRKEYYLVQIIVLVLVHLFSTIGIAIDPPAAKPITQQVVKPEMAFSYADIAITLPPPASVQLDPGGRLGERFQGNINYIRFLHDHYGEEMLEAYSARHYAPGKFKELVWDREYGGKWLDAAARTAANTGSYAERMRVDAFAAAMLDCQQPDGYVGIKLPTNRELNLWEQQWDLWNQWYAMTGFLSYYEFRGDQKYLNAASRVAAWILKTHSPIKDEKTPFLVVGDLDGGTNVAVIGQLIRLYQYTRNKDLIDFVGQVVKHYPPIQRMLSSGEPELTHPYMLSAYLAGMAQFAKVTEDYKILSWVEKVWEKMVSDHLYPTGSLGSGEKIREGKLTDRPDAPFQETCATTEWIFFTQSLYELTGRARYIEALEKTIFNALLAAQSVDGMKWCYFTPLRYHKDWFHGPTNCCYWSGPRAIARLPQLIYAVWDNFIYVNFFETSHAKLTPGGTDVKIEQHSDFPEMRLSKLTVEASSDWKGTLRIRIPAWSTNFQVYLNGEPAPKSLVSSGYYDVNLSQSAKYEVAIRFDIPFIREEFASGYFMRRGPEVLSIDVRDNDQTSLSWITFPEKMVLQTADSQDGRRRYYTDLRYASSGEPRTFLFTPYADAGNDGAVFQTVFQPARKDN